MIRRRATRGGWIVRCSCGLTARVTSFQAAAVVIRGHESHAGLVTTRVGSG